MKFIIFHCTLELIYTTKIMLLFLIAKYFGIFFQKKKNPTATYTVGKNKKKCLGVWSRHLLFAHGGRKQ